MFIPFIENLLDSSTGMSLVSASSSTGCGGSTGGGVGNTSMHCNSPSASSSSVGYGNVATVNAAAAAAAATGTTPYKLQRQQANVRERKRIQRSAPTGYTKWSIFFFSSTNSSSYTVVQTYLRLNTYISILPIGRLILKELYFLQILHFT